MTKHTNETIKPNKAIASPILNDKYENKIEKNSKYRIGTVTISAVL